MLGFKGLRSFRKKKKSQDTDNSARDPQRSSSAPPEEPPLPQTPITANNTSSLVQSISSVQSTPGQSSRPLSVQIQASPPSTPTPKARPVSEAFPKLTQVSDTPIPSQKASVKTSATFPSEVVVEAPLINTETSLPETEVIALASPSTPTVESTPRLPTMASQKIQSLQANGTSGVMSPPMSPKAIFRSKGRVPSFTSSRAASHNFSTVRSTRRAHGSSSYKIGFVQESAIALKKRSMAELGAGVYQSISDVSYIKFLEWIRSERLTTLPHKGSRWDKVLIRSLYFAEQLHKFEVAIQGFALDSTAAAAVGYGHAQLLLELSHHNSEALDKAFSVFYKFAMSFSSVLHRSELLSVSPDVREQLCLLYTDLLSLVVDVAIRFYKTVNGMTSGSVTLDIFELFGDTIETFRTRQNNVIELIWDSQIEKEEFEEGEAIDVKVLSRWLAPQDRVLESLNRDHSTFVDQQVEFTCIWFQKHLSKFIQQGDKNFLLITGEPGSGKTTLAGSIVERLQRPVNRKQFETLFCSLSPDIPTTATSLAVVKTLLYQLLNLRVGNMGTYYAVFKAYHQCRTTGDLKTYEEHLWQALADALASPSVGGKELVIVVDGLDEIAESKSISIQSIGGISPTALLERLVTVTNQAQGVRLITCSSSMKMPASAKGVHHQLTRDDLRDDIHAVALRALIHNHHFHAQRPFDQEQVLDRIIQTSNGSFLYTILVCQILNAQKTAEGLTKALDIFEGKKPSAQDLILILFNALHTTNHAKTLLSWILAAERPLTIDEIKILFTIDVQRGTFSDTGIDVDETIKTLQPFLTLHERIVRFKHPIVHAALHEFAIQNKIPIPLKDSETDLLLRVLTYAKLTLREKGEPTIENSDPSIGDRLYHQHHLLEYTVRYWVLHLQQCPLAPKPSEEFKPSADLKKVLPGTTLLPILEQLVWDTQLPLPQAIDLHKLVGTVRKATLGEQHPAVLQTYLAIATSYLLISESTYAANYFYSATIISRKVLSDIHPLTLECANYFLQITESLTTTTRTEVVTRREELLIVLITAYERQYGSTSEIVIHTRKVLAELYSSINEKDKEMEVWRIIKEATWKEYGRNSAQAREIDGHLGVVLGKGKGHDEIKGYTESFFHSDDEEEIQEGFEFGSIDVYLRRVESYISKKEFALAERTYVELWTEVSSKSRTSQSIQWHEKNIEIATQYSQFLKTQKRTTESSAILTCVWQQYEHSQIAYSESIVSRLTSVAKEMRSVGIHTQALSIFKYASSYYKSVRQEETTISREINEQLSETSTEIVKQSLNSSSSVTETTTTISESVFQDVFFSIISSSKTVESSTVAMSKKLTAQYIEKRNFSAAINVITSTLKRTWSSFLSSSIHDVTMTSTFTQESIELVERLAECYQETRQLEKVEDTYSRFFRAVLVAEKVDKSFFEKAQNLLIHFYDKHSFFDKAISIYQEILVTYRARLGASHELTIQTLYTLARRCRNHPRNHPYWIDYYLQIIASLNKDSDVCHPSALDAITVVTTTYWEDRRYAEAVSIYRVLWKTYITKTKEHEVFKEQKFVSTLYQRFYQCLEETKASWSELHQVTSEYRQSVTAVFGAESSIAVEATVSLAQVSERSEEHASQAIALYEEASTRSKTVTTRTKVTDIHQALSSLYVKQLQSSKSSTVNEQTVTRATTMTESQYQESTQMYGYSHESSLTHLRELSVLYTRQKKTDVAIKQLNTAVSQIITKEQSSQKQIESAESIASTYRSIEQTSTAYSLVQELHRQICAKDTRYTSKWNFDLTKSSRSSLAFLAALQYYLRKDLNMTFGEIMADLTLEYIYFEHFHAALRNNESLTNILLAAAPLRFFLKRNDQQEMISVVEDQAVSLFVKRDAQDLNTLSKDSPRIFIIGILDKLSHGRGKDFNRSVILSGNDSVLALTQTKKFPEAYDIANLAFLYASKHDGYNGPRAISHGFKLASLLVGRSGSKATDPTLRKKMLDLSNRIVKRILDICKNLDINFAQIQLYELSHLSVLLGEQQDYDTLEWLLTTLWTTRDAQRTWPAEVLLNLGRRLIAARYLAGHPVKAIRLAEDIAYNMRRAHGARAPVTLEAYELLAQLYTSAGLKYTAEQAKGGKTEGLAKDFYKKAVGVHEDVLRLLVQGSGVEAGEGEDSDDEFDDAAATLLAREGVKVRGGGRGEEKGKVDDVEVDASALALRHLHLLKLAYQRLGGWPKPYAEYERLNAQLFRVFGGEAQWKGVEGTEKWDAKSFGGGKAESEDGVFTSEGREWAFGSESVILDAQKHQRGVESAIV